MAYRELELTLLSARDLKNVNLFTRMDVYAVASISGDPMTRQCTPTDISAGRNPSWNATVRFYVPPNAAAAGSGWLHVLIRSQRALGDRDIGEVVVPLAELLAGADGTGSQPRRLASYQVHTVQRGEPRGVLNVSYRLGPVVAPVAERDDDKPPVVAYPVPQQPFELQNPAPKQPYQYRPPHDAYEPAQPFTPQNPAAPRPYHPPPHDAYPPPPPPRHEEALSPANGKRNGHGPTQYFMGQHTQIILPGGAPAPPRSNTIPAKANDGLKPKPSYTPTQPITSLGKTDHSWPKPSPQHQDTQTWSNVSSRKPERPTQPQHDTKVSELAHTQSKIGTGKTDHSTRPQALQEQNNTQVGNISATKTNDTRVGEYASLRSNIQPGKADSTRTKEAYATSRPNITPGKADHHSGHKAVVQHERVPSFPTATAR